MTQKPVIACLPSRKKATHRQAGVATNHRIKQSKLPACRQAGATTKLVAGKKVAINFCFNRL